MTTTSNLMSERVHDTVLVERYVAGDEAAFLEIVRRYRSMVYKLALKITGNPEDAEDATQDAFVNLSTKLDRFEGRSALKTWIYRVGVNAALMVVRGGRRHRHQELDVIGGELAEDGPRAHVLPDWSDLPDVRVLSGEAQGVIKRAIARLPETFRSVLVLADVEELANREIGEVLGLSLPAVKSRLHRARLALRRELAEYFEKRVDGTGRFMQAC